MCVSKTLERGVAVRSREFVRWVLRTIQEKGDNRLCAPALARNAER